MTLPAILLTGSSHVVSIRNAQALRRLKGLQTFDLIDVELFPRFNPLMKVVGGKFVLHEGIEPALREVIEAKAPKFVVGALWGNQHFFMATANLPQRLDFVLPSEPDLPLDPLATLVPYDVLHSWMRNHFIIQDLMLAALSRVGAKPIFALPAPPPVRDFDAIAKGSSSKALDALVAEHGVTPPALRYKFWRLAETLHVDLTGAAKATCLPLPPDVTDAQGFRRPEYYSTDWIHANTDYGELVLQQFDALLAEM